VQGKPAKPTNKVSVECPHCGSKQLESVHAQTTMCRNCGKHVDLRKRRVPEPVVEKQSFLGGKLSQFFSRNRIRSVACYDCGAKQEISTAAKSSICSQCGHYLDLRDFKISTAFSRTIQTQGSVIITRKGEVTSTRIMCGEALIQGKMQGTMFCRGTARVKMEGKIIGGIEAQHLVIEKGSRVEFARPVKADTIEIKGKVSARISASGTVAIAKTGSLDGTVYARAINVEKGGIFTGELFIGKQDLAQGELLPSENEEPGEELKLQRAS
jgi:cytoskeletal protein CcmA (bactofilin family)/ribosomal protein S27E